VENPNSRPGRRTGPPALPALAFRRKAVRTLEARLNTVLKITARHNAPGAGNPAARERKRRPAGEPCAVCPTPADTDDLLSCLETHGCRVLRVYGEPGTGYTVRW
jgi:hypothetical protein